MEDPNKKWKIQTDNGRSKQKNGRYKQKMQHPNRKCNIQTENATFKQKMQHQNRKWDIQTEVGHPNRNCDI